MVESFTGFTYPQRRGGAEEIRRDALPRVRGLPETAAASLRSPGRAGARPSYFSSGFSFLRRKMWRASAIETPSMKYAEAERPIA